MSWQLFVALNVITLSLSVLLQRVLLHKDKADPIAYAIVFQGLVAVLLGIYAAIVGFKPLDWARLWPVIALTLLAYAVGHVLYAKTLQRVEASIFSILMATSSIWIMLMGVVLLGEHMNLQQLLGAVLIFVSIGLLAERRGEVRLDKGIWLGLLTGLTFGIAGSGWVLVGRVSDVATWSAISFAGPALIVLLANPRAVTKMKPFLNRSTFARLIILGLLFGLSAITLAWAYKIGQATVVSPLTQVGIIVTIIFAIVFLHERSRLWHKLIAAGVCFAGVLLIV